MRLLSFCALLCCMFCSVASTPIIVDTDMGSDDWMAVLYLLQNPQADIKGISIVTTGESHCQPALRTLSGLLALTGRKTMPVACGRAKPWYGNKHFPNWFRKVVDQRFGIPLGRANNLQMHANAVQLLHQLLTQAKAPTTILAIGPLTNIARLLQQYPKSKQQIKRLVVLGGTLHVPGNLQALAPKQTNTAAEWNVYSDAYAAQYVVASGAPIQLVPLDACNQVKLDFSFYQRFIKAARTPAAKFTGAVMQKNLRYIKLGVYDFWDPLAAASAVNTRFYQLATAKINVNLQPGNHYAGMYVSQRGHLIHWVKQVNGAKFKRLFLNTLNRT
jgi:pyrimidine-specific ribonucleoside hydrolase